MANATEAQAQALLELGFNLPKRKRPREGYKELNGRMNNSDFIAAWVRRMRKGKNRQGASVAYITAHISQEQAGALIREFRRQLGIPRKKNITPQRQFLNEDEKHNAAILTEEAAKMLNVKE